MAGKKMAKKSKETASHINKDLLRLIVDATLAGSHVYVSQEQGLPLLQHVPAYIEVNTTVLDPNDHSKAAARATHAGIELMNGEQVSNGRDTASPYAIMTNVELPASKRGTGIGVGAPKQYPFDQLEVGHSFFVPVSAKHPDPLKTMGSTVSAANMRYAEDTGELKTVQRAKRDEKNRALKDENGEKIMETVQRPVFKFTRRFAIRGVEKGKKYGEWTAPDHGALIARVPVE